MYMLDRFPAFESARNIPSMSDYEVYQLCRFGGLEERMYDVLNYFHSGATSTELEVLHDRYSVGELTEISNILTTATANVFFRAIIGEKTIKQIVRLKYYLDPTYEAFSHDFSKIADAPYDDEVGFSYWMNGNGFGVEFSILKDAFEYTGNPDNFTYVHPMTSIRYSADLNSFMHDGYLRPIWDAWNILYTKWKNWKDEANRGGAGDMIYPGYSNTFSYVFKKITQKYGKPVSGYKEMILPADFHVSSHRLNEFVKYLDPLRGNAVDFMCGTDYTLGFELDIVLMYKAIKAEEQGANTFEHNLIVEWDTGREETFELNVSNVLSWDRCNEFAGAVKLGTEMLREMEVNGKIHSLEYEHLKDLSLTTGEPTSNAEYVYHYMLNEFTKKHKPGGVNEVLNNMLQ